PQAAKLVLIYINENERSGGKPLYVALTHLLRERGIARVTVRRGRIGIGQGARLRGYHFWPFPGDRPVVLECLDRAERIEAVLPEIGHLLTRGKYRFFEEILRFLGLNVKRRCPLTRGKCVITDGQMWR
ncbi:DUF190 domain-containing protein, partial [Desulfosporosinus sp. PR]|uniref:DUF190 domain-containing protein n=1 Tax=Candidatus Desulfosporosinus nitrosoreducens TaxID=3401928 RepID=UPI0027F57F32